MRLGLVTWSAQRLTNEFRLRGLWPLRRNRRERWWARKQCRKSAKRTEPVRMRTRRFGTLERYTQTIHDGRVQSELDELHG